jgi:TolB-like protein/Tfp pilus assembly protein PilF
MQYKSGMTRNLKEIAQQLGVGNIVEGSVRRAGNRVRVSVQLIDAQTDRYLWVQNYDRTLADSLTLQDELATEIAAALGTTLSPQEKARVEAKPTNNPAAYDAYLRGRAFAAGSPFDKPTVDGAIHSYQEAVKLDPNFVLAWAYLSCEQSGNYWLGFDPSPARLAAAKDALDRALALDPNLPQTHLALGYYRYYAQRDFTGALAEFQQAERGLPNNVDLIRAIALIQRRVGHWDEAIVALHRAVELDPRNIDAPTALAITYRCLRRFPEALATAGRVLALEPTNATALWIKAGVFWATGDLKAVELLLANPAIDPGVRGSQALFQRRYPAAIEMLSKALADKPVEERNERKWLHFWLGLSQLRAGNVAAARATYQKAAQELQRELGKVARDSFQEAELHAHLGRAYAGLGEAASAIAEGQKAMAMDPTSKDPLDGPEEEEAMAHIYALLGDADQAIPILKRLLQIPSGAAITPALLQLDPVWDQIRTDPRFQELIAEKKPASVSPPEKSIAVLPFENLSNDEENAFFAGGVQDEILSDLARIADLKVISRTSVMQYKTGSARNLREIGRALGVAHVVEGSVQRVANRVRVNAQLVDARTDAHLWAETYDRDLADVFGIQTEIARKIADQLQAKILPREKAAIEQRPTNDLVAYDLYVRAKSVIDKAAYESGKEQGKDYFQAIELLNQAIARDSAFLLAYCRLAEAHDELYFLRFDYTPSRLELANSAINSAFRLKPDSGEAHLALATHLYHGYYDYDQARDELAIAVRSLPNDARIFEWNGYIDRRQNRWHDAVRNFERAMELDPRNEKILIDAMVTHRLLRDYKKAREVRNRLITYDPNNNDHQMGDAFQDVRERADTRALHAILETKSAADNQFASERFQLALYERDGVTAERALAALKEASFDARRVGSAKFNRAYLEGLIGRLKGDAAAARAAFTAAHTQQEEVLRTQPDDGPVLCVLGLIDAALGRKEDALQEGRRALELTPAEKDSLDAADVLYFYAVLCAWVGERDLAIEQLETSAKLPGGVSYAEIRLDPHWDPLRGDSHFEKIVASLAPK